MLLAVDIGNTLIKIGAYYNKKLIFVFKIDSNRSKTKDQYLIELKEILFIKGIDTKTINAAIISSVVPSLTSTLTEAIKCLKNIPCLNVDYRVNCGLNFSDNPKELGADLLAASVSAMKISPNGCIIIDMGTATTISVINKNKTFLGAIIIPGLDVSIKALTSKSELLFLTNLEAPKKVIATNTQDAIKSGCIFGTASMIDGMCQKIQAELNSTLNVIATGGLSKYIIPFCNINISLHDNLVLDGLFLIYDSLINKEVLQF